MKVPAAVLEVLAGVILGGSLFNLISYNATIEFLSDVGLIYLIFLASLEIGCEGVRREAIGLFFMSLIPPMVLGCLLGPFMDVDPLYLGILTSTTSIGMIFPIVMESYGSHLFRLYTLESAMLVDIVSTILLSLLVGAKSGSASMMYSTLFVLILFLMSIKFRWLTEHLRFNEKLKGEEEMLDVKPYIALLLTIATFMELLGFHAILGSFIAGLMVSRLVKGSRSLLERLSSIGHGFLIPVFFISVGLTVDIPALITEVSPITLLALLMAMLFGKLVGVSTMARRLGISWSESLAIGLLHSVRFTLVMAGAKIGLKAGILNSALYSAIILTALSTVVVCSLTAEAILNRHKPSCFAVREGYET